VETATVAVPEPVDLAQEAARWPRGRDLSRPEIARILEEHRRWRESDAKEGKRGDLSYANLFMQTADELWLPYGNLRGARFMSSSLRNAVLSNADLRGASLNDADLRDASLGESDLRGAYLRNAKLAGAYLVHADMSGAIMDGAILEGEEKSKEDLEKEKQDLLDLFGKSDNEPVAIEPLRRPASLEGTNLRNAVLREARMSDVTGLRPENLAGSDLTGAKLPADIAKFELLGNVAEISKAASTTHLAMIGACFYSMITVATTNFSALSNSTAVTKLPILGTDISIATFFLAAPFVLIGVYVYFHMYLLRLWELVGTLPARFPDGRALDEKAYPWLLTSLVRLYVPLLRKERLPLWWLEVAISITTAWLLVPGTILLFVVPFLLAGCWLQTATIAALFIAAAAIAMSTMALARRYLSVG
jgi:uncharacterized protein YjbI with pentapeptide repeats